MPDNIQFTVIGEEKLHCEGCEQRVGNALRRLPGVEGVEASAQSQRVRVTIDRDRLSPEEVRDRLELLGYEVSTEGGAA